MLIGIKFSFERVYDPLITEEQRKQNGFSRKIEEQLISTQSFENTHYIDSAMDQKALFATTKEAFKAKFVQEILYSTDSIKNPD